MTTQAERFREIIEAAINKGADPADYIRDYMLEKGSRLNRNEIQRIVDIHSPQKPGEYGATAFGEIMDLAFTPKEMTPLDWVLWNCRAYLPRPLLEQAAEQLKYLKSLSEVSNED